MHDWQLKAEHYARDGFPSEVCGLVVCIKGKEKYMPCKNLAVNPLDHFIINPEDWAKAEDSGTIMAIFHSIDPLWICLGLYLIITIATMFP